MKWGGENGVARSPCFGDIITAKRMHSKMRLRTLASCLWALAHPRSRLSHDQEDRGNLATSSLGCVIMSWLERDALVATVPGFCVEETFVRPACLLLRKSQQACVASDKPGGKVTVTNAHPPQDEQLAHGWWLFCARCCVALLRKRGDRGSRDVAKSALEGAWVVHWLQSIRNEEVLRLLHRSFLALGKGRLSPRKLGKLGSGNLPDCLPQ